MSSKSKQFWNTGTNPILGYRYESLGQQVYAKELFYNRNNKSTLLCTK